MNKLTTIKNIGMQCFRFNKCLLLLLLLLPGFMLHAQEKVQVTGMVRDAQTNEPLVGVSIMAGSPPKAVGVTNASGAFSVNVTPGSPLVFRYIGFSDYTIRSQSKRELVVRMVVTENKLNETVVIGYQKKTREVTTGSAVIVSGKELQDVPVSNIEQLLQGRVAGMNIQNNTGTPGGRGMIQIRGLSNITMQGSGNDAFLSPTSPLYVIDGVPIEADANFEYGYQSAGPGVSPLSLIPPEDVESMEVLKDSQATALYGSRGAYGVILITTRRGSSPVPLVRYTGNFFINNPPQLRSTIGGVDERRLRIAQIYAGKNMDDIYRIFDTPFLADSLNPYYNNSTNWQSVFYRTTYNQTHNVNISGGDPKFNYKVDLGYYHENGVIRNTGFDRYSINTNMLYQPNPRFRVFTTLSTQVGKRNKGDGNGLTQSGVSDNASASSLLPGPAYYQSTSGILSSLQTKNDNKTANVRASLDVSYQLLKGLNAGSSVSYDYASNTEDRFTPAEANNDFSQIYAYNDRKFTLYNRNTLSYFYTLNDNHNFFISAFNEFYNRGFQAQVIRQEKTPNNQYEGPLGYDGWASRGGGLLDNYSKQHVASFAGTFSYNYKQKYVLDLSYRMDGTSSSGFEDPYSKNPAIGVRWNFNKEAALTDAKWLTYGSLRGSWGQNIVPTGDIFSIYGTYDPRGTYNANPRLGINFNQLPNTYLQPTATTQYNFGLEAGFFESRVEVIFDAYYKTVKNLLRTKPLSNMTGFNEITTNETSLINYGYELTMTFRPLPRTSKVQWTVSVNAALNKDILTHLPDGARQLIQYDNSTQQHTLFRVGRNSLTNFLLKTEGVYATDADVPVDPATGQRYRTASGTYFRAGDPIWKDVDGNYILNDNDLVPAGNSQPLITGGLQSYVNWKNFSLNLSTSFTLIRDILNNAFAERMQFLGDPYKAKAVVDFKEVDYWKGSGGNPSYPNPFDYQRYKDINPYRYNQTLIQEDGSYFKINTVTLAYLLNRKFTNRYNINSVRMYLSCNNLVTFSGYSGPNPENVSAMGRDQSGGYPIPRSYNFGMNVEF
ncbi:SusC/RagA family TonB-linked outer membrane protein [Chitinophaga tropicalis]|uniref:SusC/RagA family TonB-linked outer membrane protein n=1 Tax=Chitinophaga tropicalis TaxID=2683588 RepID=A0A7K1UDY0_9BACT|nr:SusC/RagA family TonB-linked outer membrane protein [Chitinophaga tropicalis]MVT12480.1 SusC/RagA family TonB-linked outer membrane protein [Chitinophaga tropicalis]